MARKILAYVSIRGSSKSYRVEAEGNTVYTYRRGWFRDVLVETNYLYRGDIEYSGSLVECGIWQDAKCEPDDLQIFLA